MTIKFAGKYYPDDMTLANLHKQLKVESAFVVTYKIKDHKEQTAQEILDEC